MSDLEYELQTTDDGHQALVTNIPGILAAQVLPDGATIIQTERLDLSAGEYAKAMTNIDNVDTISASMTATDNPKQATTE